MADVDFDTEEVRAAVEDMCMSIHVDVRNLADEFRSSLGRPYYTTPTSYLELISTYKTLLNQKRMAVSRQQTRYERGLDKVINAERDVNIMKEELISLQPKLVQTSKEVAEALVVVDKETAAAQVTKDAVLKDEAAASEKAAAANAIKEDCEADLAKAMPALNAALKEVDKLTKNDIQQVKAMKKSARSREGGDGSGVSSLRPEARADGRPGQPREEVRQLLAGLLIVTFANGLYEAAEGLRQGQHPGGGHFQDRRLRGDERVRARGRQEEFVRRVRYLPVGAGDANVLLCQP